MNLTLTAIEALVAHPEAAVPVTCEARPPDTGREIAEILVKGEVLTRKQLTHALKVRAKLPTGRPLLGVLRDLGMINDEQIRTTLRTHRLSVGVGSLLVELGYLKEVELSAALEIQKQSDTRKKLGDILVEQRFIDENRLIEVLAIQLGFVRAYPDPESLDRVLMQKVKPRWCAQYVLVPLRAKSGKPLVAMADPLDRTSREAVASVFGAEIEIAIAGRREILDALASLEPQGHEAAVAAPIKDTAVTAMVESIITEALNEGASDIHIEPLRNRLRVRYRTDGVLLANRDLDIKLAASLVSRIKILANIDISEKRRHQDGRIHFEDPQTGRVADIRVSVFVTLFGQKVVMRLLAQKAKLLDIRDAGFSPRMLQRFLDDALDLPSGVILITGPTGSGKTTTLYGAVNYLNNDQTSIVTAEDPVEYVVEGIAQCSINPALDITFEETMRHVVRQDPDVIVLGEIRDQQSAESAIQAALTGHKVLTTFHTEDTIGGLLRLMNMNIESFLISSTVVSVVAQRLLRRVCEHCAQPHQPIASELRKLGYTATDLGGATLRIGKGCRACHFTGYSGRVAVFELLVLNEPVKDAILNRRSSFEIRRISMETSGLITLMEDGIHKAVKGETSLAEVLYHLPRLEKPRSIAEIKRLSGD